MIKFFIVIVFVATTVALAAGPKNGGKNIGNGGRGYVCKNGKIVFVDLFRGQNTFKVNMQFAEGDNEFTKTRNLILRLQKYDPIRATKYLKDLNSFKDEAIEIPSAVFVDTDDSSEFAIPDGCNKLVTLINQSIPATTIDPRYRINKPYYVRLDADQKAALIMHEIIYKEALELWQDTSDFVIKFNVLIHSKLLDSKFTQDDYITFLRTINFPVLSMLAIQGTEEMAKELKVFTQLRGVYSCKEKNIYNNPSFRYITNELTGSIMVVNDNNEIVDNFFTTISRELIEEEGIQQIHFFLEKIGRNYIVIHRSTKEITAILNYRNKYGDWRELDLVCKFYK